MKQRRFFRTWSPWALALAVALGCLNDARGTPTTTPWTPIFKGIDRLAGTNTPDGGGVFTNLQVIYALRVDLTDPDIRLFTSPRFSNYVANVQETAGFTVSDFVRTNRLQAAINANFFSPGQYYLPAGTPMEISGLAVSEGVVVSDQENAGNAASVVFDAANRGSIIHTNWPATNTAGIFTAVSGGYPVLINGTNVGYQYLTNSGFIHEPNPRSVLGLSADRQYFFMVAIDGRQPGYSDGAYDYESAEWLRLLGASDAVSMDGGGSTTLSVQETTGAPVALNRSSAVANDPQGRERTVGSHIGVFARPLPGFINDVVAAPQDTSASITWTTVQPSDSRVEYDTTTNFTFSSATQPGLETNHTVVLSGLTLSTEYFFRVLSGAGTTQYVSPIYTFVTTASQVLTNQLLAITNSWKYSTADLDGTNWTAPDYADSGWSPLRPGLFWIDPPPLNPQVGPKNTELPIDSSSGYPYFTYYFRTRFAVTNPVGGEILRVSALVDDGAVFYLNGTEIGRVRMEPYPAPVLNGSLATGSPPGGDATAPDEFTVFGSSMTNLVAGENVLAAEVHNYLPNGRDITFGMTLVEVRPDLSSPTISITQDNGVVTLNWTGSGFTLQEAADIDAAWTNVPGPVVSGPLTITNSAGDRFFRLIR